jgi:predicted nucleic acid-binding protein
VSHKDHLACLDDRLARSFAEELGLRVIGIVGVLIIAKRERLIGEMAAVLEHLKYEGFRLGDDVISEALHLAGEKS